MTKAKTLFLVRHAKSSWSDPSLSDLERPLNKRGSRNAPDMGKRLAKTITKKDSALPIPEQILTSPAVRAQNTAKVIAKALNIKPKTIEDDERLYFQGAKSMLDVIVERAGESNSLMVVGHNPDITDLYNLLSGLNLDKMPTCAIAILQFQTPSWTELGQIRGELIDFDFPKKTLKTK